LFEMRAQGGDTLAAAAGNRKQRTAGQMRVGEQRRYVGLH